MRLSELRGLLRDRPLADPAFLHAAMATREAEMERYVRTTAGNAMPHSGAAAEVTDDELRAEMASGTRSRPVLARENLVISQLARDGLLDTEIAERTGLHHKTVSRRRAALGLPSNLTRAKLVQRRKDIQSRREGGA